MRIYAFVLLLQATLSLAHAACPTITRLYVFGDSYSDTGAGYVDGNGPTAVAYFADRLGLNLVPPGDPHAADTQSLNFAVSGAPTGADDGNRVKDALLGRGMKNQVEDFVSRVRSEQIAFDPSHTLFYIAGGLNDGRFTNSETVSNLETEIRQLYDAGGRYFAVALLPVKIPGFAKVATRLNPSLQTIPGELEPTLAGAHLSLSHWGPFFDEVMEHPSQYGIENTTDACAGRALFGQDPTPCSKPEAHYYYHASHPSTAVHKVVGSKLYEELMAACK